MKLTLLFTCFIVLSRS